MDRLGLIAAAFEGLLSTQCGLLHSLANEEWCLLPDMEGISYCTEGFLPVRFIKTLQQCLVAETMQTEMVVESLTQPLVVEFSSLPKLKELIVGRSFNFRSYSIFQCGSQLMVSAGRILRSQCCRRKVGDRLWPFSARHEGQ